MIDRAQCLDCHQEAAIKLHQKHWDGTSDRGYIHNARFILDFACGPYMKWICAYCGFAAKTDNHFEGECKHE